VSFSTPPDPLAAIWGEKGCLLLRGREDKGMGKGKEGMGRGRADPRPGLRKCKGGNPTGDWTEKCHLNTNRILSSQARQWFKYYISLWHSLTVRCCQVLCTGS